MGPVKLAIIGGGPSAFYAASRLLSLLPHSSPDSPPLRIHLFDRLWAPHGLVRYGVAPDHPEVKNCTNKFDATATDPRFRFFGNVNIGSTSSSIPHVVSLPLSSVLRNYTHLLFASGCPFPTLHPAIPPSDSCVPALSFVHWYTQHPSNPPPPALDKITHLTLIGNGNVSLDVARMLLTSPSVLQKYDVPQHVLEVLSRSAIKHVSIIGRRGPLEAAFTNKELREMMHLPGVSMVPIDSSLFSLPEGTTITRQQKRTLDLLRKGSENAYGTTPKTWSLDFFRSPTGLTTPQGASPDMAQLTLAHTCLDPVSKRAIPTTETSSLPTSLVVTSLGFHTDPEAPFFDPSTNHLRSVAGRILSPLGTAVRNVYASGWAANGAKGVLASTMMDAYAVADTILSDITLGDGAVKATAVSEGRPLELSEDLRLNPEPHPDDLPEEILQGIKDNVVTQYQDWKAIDAEEIRRGNALSKERERMKWDEAQAFLSRLR